MSVVLKLALFYAFIYNYTWHALPKSTKLECQEKVFTEIFNMPIEQTHEGTSPDPQLWAGISLSWKEMT